MNFLKKLFSKKTDDPVDLPPEFLQESAPDWLLDLKGQQLPEGNTFSIRTQLFNSTRTGAVEILILPSDQSGQPATATTGVDRLEIDRLFVILGFSFPAEIMSVSADTDTGLPVTVSIYRHEPFAHQAADCNLAAWVDSKQPAPPAVEIARILFAIRQRALPL